MRNAPTHQATPEPITFSGPEEAAAIIQSYYELRADFASSAYFGGARAGDADTIAGGCISAEGYAAFRAAERYLDELADGYSEPTAPAAVDLDEIPF